MSDEHRVPMPRGAEPSKVLRVAAECADAGARVVLATVLARRGSTPSTPGQKLLLSDNGACVGTIGGGAIERESLLQMQTLLADHDAPPSRIHTFKLGAELGMCCGGGVDVLFEVLASAVPVLVVGAGHIGAIVAPLLARSGFAVTLCDERENVIDPDQRPGLVERERLERVLGDFETVGRTIRRSGAVLTMTHDHQLDQQVIEWALREKFAFVGGVGSRAKLARTRTRLEAKSFPASDLERIRMPLGIEIGARSPHEIAISIVAELIAWRRR